eukprot:6474801-Amphidinium_carterae.1
MGCIGLAMPPAKSCDMERSCLLSLAETHESITLDSVWCNNSGNMLMCYAFKRRTTIPLILLTSLMVGK